ncbi:uncharacterized protein LOC113508084 isoform X2 [Trichoplusia ni]|uniref:protein acetyllysine N-acetyltransferase n=1 Tax=Trichoplusia ni TaxID=7111 RepID=A0A7E5X392_TRINI|nr:uncharacterized protein LOC113508084 isoform X2 [Trichoplusia ni]
MSDRGGVRSSARLSGDSSAAAAAAAPRAAAQGRGRPVSTTAAAALRRARAAERAAEVEDSPRVLRDKCRRLARALRNAKHLVVYTGAGISTAADIPDYRGPHGVWTRLQRGETVGRVEVSRAQPTFTHMALTALWARGALKFVVSQNCDGLHLRAGLPRRALAELHGDMFAELCAACRRVYLRAFDTTERTARHQHGTRRLCHDCGAELRDSIVHFGERGRAAWPLNWAGALRHAARADVVLCLGSSLKVLRRYPRLWRMQSAPRARPALYIVNLQWTPKDSVAALKINARCDAVMRQVARRLRLRVPRYRASRDPVLAHAEPLAPAEAHTTRRPALLVPPDEPPADDWEPSSPSASDSDEELPLRRLADRLRGPNDADQPRSPGLPNSFISSTQTDTQSSPTENVANTNIQQPSELIPNSQLQNSTNYEVPYPDRSKRQLSPTQESRLSNFDQPYSPIKFHKMCSPPRPDRLSTSSKMVELYDQNQSDRLCSQNNSRLHSLSPRERQRSISPNELQNNSSPNGWHNLNSSDRQQGFVECDKPNGRLHSFQVSMQSGEATILLRAEHAPPRPLPPRSRSPRCRTADLRRFRMARRPPDPGLGERLRRLLEYEPRIDAAEPPPKLEEPKAEPKAEPKDEPKEEASTSDESGAGALAAGSLAAAIIRRAVLLCRASLYPGLHTIIAPAAAPAAPAAPADCAWCARQFAARRCLWYGPAREPPPGARAWRRLRGRRYLCACCGAGPAPEPGPPAAPGPPGPDDGGWYGKGYRKGRRRRR